MCISHTHTHTSALLCSTWSIQAYSFSCVHMCGGAFRISVETASTITNGLENCTTAAAAAHRQPRIYTNTRVYKKTLIGKHNNISSAIHFCLVYTLFFHSILIYICLYIYVYLRFLYSLSNRIWGVKAMFMMCGLVELIYMCLFSILYTIK